MVVHENITGSVLSSSVYWTGIPFYILGIFLNVAFIYITSKEDQRHKTAVSLASPCYVQICYAVTMLVKTTCYYSMTEQHTTEAHYFSVIICILDVLLNSLYVWLYILLNATRWPVLKNINKVHNLNGITEVVKSSQISKWLLLSFVMLITIAYGIVSFLDLSRMTYFAAKVTLRGVIIDFPWVFLLLLSSVMLLYTLCFMHKRRLRTNRLEIEHNTGKDLGQRQNNTSIWAKPTVADQLIQQVFYSLLFQTFFMILPFGCNVIMNFISIRHKEMHASNAFVYVLRSFIPLLNPVALGIFLKQRRNNLSKFLNFQKISSSFMDSETMAPTNDHLEPIPEGKETAVEDAQNAAPSELFTHCTIQTTGVPASMSLQTLSSVNDESSNTLNNPYVYFRQDCRSTESDFEIDSVSVYNESPVGFPHSSCSNSKCNIPLNPRRLSSFSDQLSRQSTLSNMSDDSRISELDVKSMGRKKRMTSRTSSRCTSGRSSYRTHAILRHSNSSASILSIASTIQDTISYF